MAKKNTRSQMLANWTTDTYCHRSTVDILSARTLLDCERELVEASIADLRSKLSREVAHLKDVNSKLEGLGSVLDNR